MAAITLASGARVEIADVLYEFVRDEAVTGTGWTADRVFEILGELVQEFGPRNQELLAKRVSRQGQIDQYYISKREAGWEPTSASASQDAADFERFLVDIGYLEPEIPIEFSMTTPQLDADMDQNGPELVTPVNNASMAVGGANARWGSLYDAYFLSDVHPEIDRDANRSARLRMVVEQTTEFLDAHVAQWTSGVGFKDIVSYSVRPNPQGAYELVGNTGEGDEVGLTNTSVFVGFNRDGEHLSDFFLEDNGLNLQFQLYDGGGVNEENGQFRDLFVESAITNIVDFEDAVAIVDAEDMVLALRNYLGLMIGDLRAYGSRGNLKTMNSDKTYLDVNGVTQTLKGTSLMSVRNVSLHMYTGMVKVAGQEIPERILGVLLTTLIAASHDKGSSGVPSGEGTEPDVGPIPNRGPNSKKGYVYQVTPNYKPRRKWPNR